METLLCQPWQKLANRLERDTNVGAVFENSAIVQAENRAIDRALQQARDNIRCLPFPV